MKSHPKFPGKPMPYIAPPPPNTYRHLLPVVASVMADANDSLSERPADPDPINTYIEDLMRYLLKAAEEARSAALEAGCSLKDAQLAAGAAYRSAMPALPASGSPRLYIATIAHGLLHGYISAPESRLMLYSAQLVISAGRKGVSR